MVKKDDKTSFLEVIHPTAKVPLSVGERAADWIAGWAGSWKFIIGFVIILLLWMAANSYWIIFGKAWDPYPFILLNLVLSCLAAFQAPVILMSQNRQAQRDRIQAKYDYAVNRKSHREIVNLQKQLNRIERKISGDASPTKKKKK